MSAPSSTGPASTADDRDGPIERVIAFSVANRAVVLLVTLALALWGVHALRRTPIDAIPDLSENQVIVFTDWPGRSPQELEDQVTYPLSVNLQGLAGVKAVRSTSEFNYSMVNVIFDEGVGFYFARDRVLERLSTASTFLPPGVVPYLAPDATALGQIFWYTVEGPLDPGELRSIQDWYVRYQLNAVPGVAQVASVGGFVQAYQVDVDPHKLRAYGVTLGQVFEAVARSNSAVGGDVLVKGGAEYLIRGDGWLRGTDDIASIVITERDGVPVFVRHVASVQLGPEPRRAALEKQGEAVGGVVLMRWGENPLEVTRRVKEKIAALQPGLPPGVRIVPFYDRTPLIEGAIATLRRTLLEEMAVASLMVFLVLFHLRSSIVICATLPLSVLLSFIAMHHLGVPSNIMSLSGIAISIGVLLDAGIVMTESAYTRLHEAAGGGPVTGDTRPVVLRACKLVGRPLFFSVLIMLVSFLPVFALEGIEGRMFRPLALTKTFALVGVAVLAVTVVPALIPTFVRGRLRSEQESWVVRSVAEVYRPVLAWLLRRPRVVALCFAALLGLGLNLAPKLGREFMPPLDEGSIMDMPVTIPSASVSRAADDLAARDALLRRLPEVDLVVGKAGRAETPTDPSPVDMVETVITLRPRDHWPRRGVEYEAVLAAARAAVGEEHGDDVAMDAAVAFDRFARELSLRRLEEHAPALGLVLLRGLVDDLLAGRDAPDLDRGVVARRLADPWGPRLAAGPLEWEVAEAAREAARLITASQGGDDARALLVRPPGPLEALAAPLRQLVAAPRPTLEASLFTAVTARRDAALTEQVRRLEWELEDRAPAALREAIEAAAAARGLTAAPAAPGPLALRRRTKQELVQELDSIAQVPGWANIWTQPIINRVDMLATGVRTMIGVKVFGGDLDTIQRVADRVAEVLRGVPGAVDVFPDQVVGERYLEVVIDRERAARYGVAVQEVQDTIEVALGGRRVTTAIGGPPAPAGGAVRPGHEGATRTDGRRRLPVRVRYARDLREDEAQVRRILVSGSAGVQVPLGEVADVRVVQGPSMIKSEDGLLRAYVQLNVRDRDVIGFVDEARRVVEDEVVARGLPQGVYLEWSGQFEHQVRARERLALIVPLVVFLIFVILYLTYQDLGDALLMMLAVPGALVGGLIFQALFDVSFSVAVWVGYIACFGLATETGIIMLVYLREAIERRGGLANIATVDELEAAVLEGAVQRLRPKLLTEGTTILGLVPMLMAEGVGAEVMRPMAAPVLGGVLLADEVIDVFIPVIFFWYRRRRWERLQTERAAAQADALEVTA